MAGFGGSSRSFFPGNAAPTALPPHLQKMVLEGISNQYPETVKPFEPAPAPTAAPQQAPQPAPTPAPTPMPAPQPTPAPAPAPAPTPAPQAGPALMALQQRAEPLDAGAGWAQVSEPGHTRPGLGQRLPFSPGRPAGIRY